MKYAIYMYMIMLTRRLEIEREAGLQLQQLSGAQREILANETAGESSYRARSKGQGLHTHILLYMLKFHVHVCMHTQPHLYTKSPYMQSEWGGWVHSLRWATLAFLSVLHIQNATVLLRPVHNMTPVRASRCVHVALRSSVASRLRSNCSQYNACVQRIT